MGPAFYDKGPYTKRRMKLGAETGNDTATSPVVVASILGRLEEAGKALPPGASGGECRHGTP